MDDFFSDFPTLQRTAADVITAEDLRSRLASGRQLRIKYGVDVTAPFLHIGHAVNLWAMREMQQAGHKVVLFIGDFTTRIGDPTGRSASRPVIPAEQIERDAEAFVAQAGRVLLTDPAVFEVRRNSEWWAPMPLATFLSLLSEVTHARLIQRDMFQARIAAGAEIRMHELLYPILQGYDSCELDSDLTIVGTDQHFNELMGRLLAERLGGRPQAVITTEVTPGIDGRAKQGKSLGNYAHGYGRRSQQHAAARAQALPPRLIEQPVAQACHRRQHPAGRSAPADRRRAASPGLQRGRDPSRQAALVSHRVPARVPASTRQEAGYRRRARSTRPAPERPGGRQLAWYLRNRADGGSSGHDDTGGLAGGCECGRRRRGA